MYELINAYSIKLMNSFLLTFLFMGLYLTICWFWIKKNPSPKRLKQLTIRLRYFLIVLFMVFFIKIWVNGFIQILAFIGFIGAAFTLTQKDTLMNLVGFLIINWRGLFHEGDYIRIQTYAGFVRRIGLLYFTLLEASADFPSQNTGRLIKVPNGLVARNPITNFSHEKFVENTVNFIFKPNVSFANIEILFDALKKDLMTYLYSHTTSENAKAYEPKHLIKIRQEKPAGLELVMMFYAKHQDKTELLYKLHKGVVDFTEQDSELFIAFD